MHEKIKIKLYKILAWSLIFGLSILVLLAGLSMLAVVGYVLYNYFIQVMLVSILLTLVEVKDRLDIFKSDK